MRRLFCHFITLPLICLCTLVQGSPVRQLPGDSLPRLSPRPEAVAGVSRCETSLNGTWQFSHPGVSGKPIQVPGEWEMQGFHLDSAAQGTYTRHFSIPDDWEGRRIKLRFDAVSSHCVVLVNGRPIASHEGSFVPFEMDITREARPGQNQLEVRVACQTVSDILASTSQYAGHPVGGILRKVTLFALPGINLGALTYVTRFDAAYQNATLEIPLEICNEAGKAGKVQVEFSLRDQGDHPVALSRDEFSLGTVGAGESKRQAMSLQVTAPEKWNPEHPYLYTLITNVKVDGALVETHRQKVGFRQVEIRGNQLFVNNHPVKLHGVCRHSIAPYTGRSVSPALCIEDAVLFREGNCNFIRTSHYPPEEEFLNACDSLGLFVESESSLCWIGHGAAPIWKIWKFDDPRFLPFMMQANLEKMIADRSHPSVIIWSLGNESEWSPLWDKINQRVKRLDPSRPTIFQDQAWGSYNNAGSTTDIANYHYPHFDGPAASDTMHRPLQFDEFAHLENYNRLEVLTDPYVRVAWGPSLERIYDSMYLHPGCLGGAIWAGIDDIFHLPSHEMIGYGPWGPVDGWRRKKPEFYGMAQAFAPVKVKNADHPLLQDGHWVVQLENRYDFLNLSALKIECVEGSSVRRLSADIAPHCTGTLRIPLGKGGARDSIWVVFNDPRGFESQCVLIGVNAPRRPTLLPAAPTEVTLSDQGDHYVIHAGKVSYAVNRKTGLLQRAEIGADRIPLSSPSLMIVPLNRDDGGGPGVTNCNYQTNLPPLMYKPYGNWKAAQVTAATQPDGTVRVSVQGSYSGATGTLTMNFQKDGTLKMHYDFVLGDSAKINPRQWGLALTLPASFDRLTWNRKGHRSAYPKGDIARIAGSVLANPSNRENSLTWEKPSVPWALDANSLGTNDFRSTKANIYSASLTNSRRIGVEVLSDGSQSARAWIDGDRVIFLTADFNTGGSDSFSSFFYQDERRPLKAGSRVSGDLHIRLVNNQNNQTL